MAKRHLTEAQIFQSEEFKKLFAEQVKEDTWEKGLPMVYAQKNGNIVEHWKDGTIKIIGHVKNNKLKIKNQYCQQNNINLLRISYKEYEKTRILLEKSLYVV